MSGPLETADRRTQFVDTAAPANGRPRGHVTSNHLDVVGTAPARGPSLALKARPISPLGLLRGRLADPDPSNLRRAVPQPSNVARAAPQPSDAGRAASQPSDTSRAALEPCSVRCAHAYRPRFSRVGVIRLWRRALLARPIGSFQIVSRGHCIAADALEARHPHACAQVGPRG